MPHPKKEKSGRVSVTVEFTADQMSDAEESALKKLGESLSVQGFRPGKAPHSILREKIDPSRLMEETVKLLAPGAIKKILLEHGIKPIIPPKIETVSEKPLTLKITLIEHPPVEVKGADKISIRPSPRKVEEKDVNEMIDYILSQHAKPPQADKAPAGKEIAKPMLTDEFAREKLNAQTADQFKTRVKQSMEEQEKRIAKQRCENEVFDKIKTSTAVELADELIEEEMRDIYSNFLYSLRERNLELKDWMKKTGKKEKEFLEDLRKQAKDRLTLRFGIRHLIEKNNISFTDEEISGAVSKLLSHLPDKERAVALPLYEKGASGWEQLKWEMKVERLIDAMIED